MKDLNLSPLEQRILQRSSDHTITRRRRTIVVIAGVTAAILLVGAAWLKQSWQFVLILSLVYIGVTVFEKIAYANAVLVYKSLIQKLKIRIEELQPNEDS
jgi:hypothetical protein